MRYYLTGQKKIILFLKSSGKGVAILMTVLDPYDWKESSSVQQETVKKNRERGKEWNFTDSQSYIYNCITYSVKCVDVGALLCKMFVECRTCDVAVQDYLSHWSKKAHAENNLWMKTEEKLWS